MRTKESANDYRYFPEPDLQPVMVSHQYITAIKALMPELPNDIFKRYTKDYSLSDYDAGNLTDVKEIALYFNELAKHTKNYKAAANWVMGAVKSHLNESALHIDKFELKPERIAELISIIDEGKISNSVASQKVFPAMLKNPEKTPLAIAEELNVIQDSNADALQDHINQAIAMYPDKVTEYKNGKVNLVGLFMGEVMKLSKGKADPKLASKLVKETLDKK